ncbi:covalently-linked cell wall protein [Colletotrichum plurivorum]|uniref:Covalently-linked cell wall protein n=1 Tax=Colletotrichum plurivorum TaxID=2175906 RepID=A0A8H6NAL9_9PEZI|nr:covalently-linked cell wall protein [Colletotrichum plurivorum]
MKFSIFGTFALAGMAMALPQASPAASGGVLAPKDGPPASCKTSFDGEFGLTVVDLAKTKRSLEDRTANCGPKGSLGMTLKDGVLIDTLGRTGSIVSNFQFQFDGPPQAGVIYTSGFSVCGNGSLALGGSATFYKCASGNFYNLYDRHWALQCSPIHLAVLPCGDAPAIPSGGNVVGTTWVATTVVTVIEDGQPQVVPTTVPIPICQIGDGQIQGHTTPCGQLPPVTKTPAPPASSASKPPYTPPGTPSVPPVTTPAVPPVKTTNVPTPSPNTTAPVRPPADTTPAPGKPSSTTPVAPPVAGGHQVVPAPLLALVAGLLALVYMV